MAEQTTLNRQVQGSTPWLPTSQFPFRLREAFVSEQATNASLILAFLK
jgi:hypothetical protein